MMKYIHEINNKKRAMIEYEENVGFFLYIYDVKTGENTHDYLEDTLLAAQQKAQADFDINMNFWRLV